MSGLFQLIHYFVFSLLASSQRPEEVIQRYMEVVAGVPDEVNVSWSGLFSLPDIN